MTKAPQVHGVQGVSRLNLGGLFGRLAELAGELAALGFELGLFLRVAVLEAERLGRSSRVRSVSVETLQVLERGPAKWRAFGFS